PLSLYLSLPFLLAHPYSHSFPTRRSSDLFVLPLYFTISEEVGGRNDFLGRVHDGKTLKSFGVNPGGYIGFFNPATNKRETFTGKDRKSTRLNSSHGSISYAVFCLKKKTTN